MAYNYFKIVVNQDKLDKLFSKYGEELTEKAIRVVNKYTNKISNEAKKIIDESGYRDTGRLINSIKHSIYAYIDRIIGEVNGGTKYAQYIHEGVKHPTKSSERTVPFFVPFKVAPTLFKWAVRNKVIESIDGVYRLASTGQIVEPDRGGLQVHIAPAKYFEKPFNQYKDQFVEEVSNIINKN
ncbi:HK97 gp10 family phage protein [Tepidimicrobium xylanilyticum]|uniref:Bacteriophage HK97-gp10, putative tail-component n=1 Tax=Tepidimicrobium xylanilyticum TaxID=1123352 RepID=A0A1H3EJN9_9FIRM|nr:HK97 gp10 family phage protein [Tepidimicrobium xylanilyticum]GMG96253.1 hypothetical protein EN5CB1_10790 [Tepidimicrobium xylanilyticum]SDX78805.1 Bacteriophage HK97-gp10, putative tail-component [Tepidimicrobium xylanilyticum]